MRDAPAEGPFKNESPFSRNHRFLDHFEAKSAVSRPKSAHFHDFSLSRRAAPGWALVTSLGLATGGGVGMVGAELGGPNLRQRPASPSASALREQQLPPISGLGLLFAGRAEAVGIGFLGLTWGMSAHPAPEPTGAPVARRERVTGQPGMESCRSGRQRTPGGLVTAAVAITTHVL